MSKILKPYTIIPLELYVQRDADRQLDNIIIDMGRPGYVLVSRQMGKTNLLLNAKRKFENENDLFVYVDLSNPFDSLKSCFENIIDTTIETHPNKFEEVRKKILNRRNELVDTTAHKQHTNELRELLKTIQGKLVIILDEIDALTKTNYSDQIFAQIRSVYFSRANFKEFDKLTYILSGVIEPSEIIKDPKISPFNIGQKIFLNDFSRGEFEQFINKAKLKISNEISERIFYWTQGNPRMTWDVCSEVENESVELNTSVIDKIVYNLYLQKYDHPPIDNIREIVKNDKEIRNSIIEIFFNKGNEISDKIKSRLYLAGIINYDDNEIHIKNEVISKSLNYDWLRKLEEEEKGLIKIAMEEFAKNNYVESLRTFEEYLKVNEFENDDNKPFYYMAMADSAYSLGDFEKALNYYEESKFDAESEGLRFYRVLYQKGLCYYSQGNFEKSLEEFNQIISSKRNDRFYALALLNFAAVSMKNDKNSNTEAVQIFQNIINDTAFNSEKLEKVLKDEIKTIAFFNLAQLQKSNGEIEKAIENYKEALSICADNVKPTIILSLIEIQNLSEDNFGLISEAIEIIVTDKITPTAFDPQNMDFTYNRLRDIIIYSFVNYEETLFQRIKFKLDLFGEADLSEQLFDCAIYCILTKKDILSALKLLEKNHQNFNNPEFSINNVIKYRTLKFLCYLNDAKKSLKIFKEFAQLVSKENIEVIDSIDIENYVNLIRVLFAAKNYPETLKYCNEINYLRHKVEDKYLINYLVVLNIELNIFVNTNERKKSVIKAEQILELINDKKIAKEKTNVLSETGFEIIKQNAEYILNPTIKQQVPIKIGKTYGRNESVKVRYKDGTILETKYKKVSKDIEEGECFILVDSD